MRLADCRPAIGKLDPGIAGGNHVELSRVTLGKADIAGAQREFRQRAEQLRVAPVQLVGTGERIICIAVGTHRGLDLAELGPIIRDIVFRADELHQCSAGAERVVSRSGGLIFAERRARPGIGGVTACRQE